MIGTDLSPLLSTGNFPNTMVGTGTGSGGGGFSLSGNQLGLLGGGLASLFGGLLAPEGSADKALGTLLPQVTKNANALSSTGTGLLQKGQADLGPVMTYLQRLASGDPAAELEATAPDRRRVIDQYDTARRTIAAGPRGGGTAGANAQSYTSEASDLATMQAASRTGAISKLGDLSTTLSNLGISAESIAGTELGNVVQAYLDQSKEQAQSASALGQGVGSLIGLGLSLLHL